MVTVVGSLNIDYLASVRRLPHPGETVHAIGFFQRFGGKGANQAIAAARQGSLVTMIGCVGSEPEGRAYLVRLRKEGIRTNGVSVVKNSRTGSAMIVVDQHGENTIVVAAGANGELTGSMVTSNQKHILSSKMLLVQLEVGIPAVSEAVRIANRAGIPVVLNASPIRDDLPWGKWKLDTVIVNESEALAIFGPQPRKVSDRYLAKKGIETLIITRGARSTIVASRLERLEIPTAEIQPVDTVGAGDAFTGTYVSRRAEGSSVASAVCQANCAGALATLKFGAQESIPTRRETERVLRPPNYTGLHL